MKFQIREDIQLNGLNIYPIIHANLTEEEIKFNNKIKVLYNLFCQSIVLLSILLYHYFSHKISVVLLVMLFFLKDPDTGVFFFVESMIRLKMVPTRTNSKMHGREGGMMNILLLLEGTLFVLP